MKKSVIVILALVILVGGLVIYFSHSSIGEDSEQAKYEVFLKDVTRPGGVAFDNNGNMFVSNRGKTIYKVTPDGQKSQFALVPCTQLLCISMDNNNNIYASGREAVFKIEPNGTIHTLASDFSCADDLRTDLSGNLYVADADENRVYKIAPDGKKSIFIESNSPEPVSPGWNLTGLAFDPEYKNLYLAHLNQGTIVKYPLNPDGTAGTAQIFAQGLAGPDHLITDKAGNLYVTCFNGNTLMKFDSSSQPTFVTTELTSPTSLAWGKGAFGENFIYVTLVNANRVVRVKVQH